MQTSFPKFQIQDFDLNLKEIVSQKINSKTKPLNSLGKLEEYALKIALIQNDESPKFSKPTILVFAGDHGIAKEGISPFPQEVTFQMVMNFLRGGAAINSFCHENRLELKVVDAGVNFDFSNIDNLIHAKVGFGTKNILHEKAMSNEELNLCIRHSTNIVSEIHEHGSNVIGFGEMGIGNTGVSSLLMSKILGIGLDDTVGRGTGCNDVQLNQKISILKKAFDKHNTNMDAIEILSTFGGFEIAMIVGAILRAAELRMSILIDGFIVSTACLLASKINPKILNYCFFSHLSNEKAHDTLLKNLNANPILKLDLRLGEGTGAALVYPILASSIRFLNEMASFTDAGVSNKK